MAKRMGAEAGQDLVEYALVLPLFLLLTISIFEFGILFFQYGTVANAAREAARAGTMPATAACDDACITSKVVAAARGLTAGLNPEDLTVTVAYPTIDGEPMVDVEVQYSTGYLTRMLMEATGAEDGLTLRSASIMRRE
jgi:Flp pilus assembly protein TadG